MASTWFDLNDRKAIEEMYNKNQRVDDIADKLGRNRATVYRELKKGYTGEMDANGRPGYSADIAQRRHYELKMKRSFQTAI